MTDLRLCAVLLLASVPAGAQYRNAGQSAQTGVQASPAVAPVPASVGQIALDPVSIAGLGAMAPLPAGLSAPQPALPASALFTQETQATAVSLNEQSGATAGSLTVPETAAQDSFRTPATRSEAVREPMGTLGTSAQERLEPSEKSLSPLTDEASRLDVRSGRAVFDGEGTRQDEDPPVLSAPSGPRRSGLSARAATAVAVTLVTPAATFAGDGAAQPLLAALPGGASWLGLGLASVLGLLVYRLARSRVSKTKAVLASIATAAVAVLAPSLVGSSPDLAGMGQPLLSAAAGNVHWIGLGLGSTLGLLAYRALRKRTVSRFRSGAAAVILAATLTGGGFWAKTLPSFQAGGPAGGDVVAESGIEIPARPTIAVTPALAAEIEKIEAQVKDAALRDVLFKLRAPEVATRRGAVRQLYEQRGPETPLAMAALAASLAHDPVPLLRVEAAFTLGWLGRQGGRSTAALAPLVKAAAEDADPIVRTTAVQSVIDLQKDGGVSPETVSAVAETLRKSLQDPDAGVRASAAWNSRYLGKNAAVEDLRTMAAKDADLQTRANAAIALLDLKQPIPVRPVLTDLLKDLDKEDSPSRAASAASLGQIAQYAPDETDAKDAVSALARVALESKDRNLRSSAVNDLVWAGYASKPRVVHVLPVLQQALARETDAEIRASLQRLVGMVSRK